MNLNIMNKIIILITITGLTACSSSYRKPESIEDKMARYEAKKSSNEVPDMKVISSAKFTKRFSRRAPASTASSKKKSTFQSNKRLYFLTLLNQYTQMKKYSNSESAPVLKSCPSYHTSMLDYSEKYGVTSQGNIKISFENRYSSITDGTIASYPELSLPVSNESVHPTVAEIIKVKGFEKDYGSVDHVVHKAINLHLSKTYNELAELCEYGTSDNYYAYENLVTHVKRKQFPASAKSMKTLLKTTLFSNMAIISSFEKGTRPARKKGRGLASTMVQESYTEQVMKRMGVEWAETYFSTLKSSN